MLVADHYNSHQVNIKYSAFVLCYRVSVTGYSRPIFHHQVSVLFDIVCAMLASPV